MSELIQAGVDTSLQERSGRTPLHCALYMAKERATRMLVNSVSDVNVQDKKGKSLLHVAARAGCIGIVKILLARGGDIFLLDKEGWTPLHDAARGGCVEIVKILLSAGSNPRLPEDWGHTPLLIALTWGLEGVAEALLEIDGENNLPNRFSITPLKEAARRGFSGIVRRLLFCGVLPQHLRYNEVNYLGWALEKVSIAEMVLPMIALEDVVIDLVFLEPWYNPNHENVPYYVEILEDCRAELQQMKKEKVVGTTLSYYDLARMHVAEVERYVGNKDFQRHWRDKVQDFPHYADLIEFKVRRAEERKILSAQCAESLAFLSLKLPSLSHVSLRIILAHLCEWDISQEPSDPLIAPGSERGLASRKKNVLSTTFNVFRADLLLKI